MKLGLSSFTYGWAVGGPRRARPRPLDELDLLEQCWANLDNSSYVACGRHVEPCVVIFKIDFALLQQNHFSEQEVLAIYFFGKQYYGKLCGKP